MLFLLLAALAGAGEGYWRADQVKDMKKELKALGVEMSAKDLADPAGPVFGATVWFGHCTGSFVSTDGLILTNAHCVRSWLQQASSDERGNLVQNGFVAPSRADEVGAGPAARVFVPLAETEVTKKMLKDLPRGADDKTRSRLLRAKAVELQASCEAKPNRRCQVVPEFGGASYRLVEQLEIEDVRLVYAPPDDIAVFGGDVDNWRWPRHTGDFAFVRAWVGKDQLPAEPHADNEPFKPLRSLELNPSGPRPGDTIMLPGYPVRTHRYLTTSESKHAALVRYPADIELYSQVIAQMDKRMRQDRQAQKRIEVHRFALANALENARGMRDNFARGSFASKRAADDARLDAWMAKKNSGSDLSSKLDELNKLVAHKLLDQRRDRLIRFTSWMPQLLGATRTAYRLALERDKPPAEQLPGFQERDRRRIRAQLQRMQSTIDLPTERAVLAVLLRRMHKLPDAQRAVPFDEWLAAADGPKAALTELFDSPKWVDAQARLGLLDMQRKDFERSKDPWVELAVRIETWRDSRRDADEAYEGAMTRLRPLYIDALIASRDGLRYADANGTARISFGIVEGYSPRDAVSYGPQTTVPGMADRHGPPPFNLPDDLLLAARAAGPDDPRADPNLNTVPVCFIASAENTGGNSGSPVLDSQGRVIGVAFDRNYEGMAADWFYEKERTRSIQVDVRYLLWVLDRTEGVEALMAELGVAAEARPEQLDGAR